jgi:hypothetical protein
MKPLKISILLISSLLLLLLTNCKNEGKEDITQQREITELLFTRSGTPSSWTVSGGVYSSYEEIRNWKELGFNVTKKDLATTEFPETLLQDYNVLRIVNPGSWSDSESETVHAWVLNGGCLFVDICHEPISIVSRFGVEDIEGSHGGSSGLSWIYHGAPWEFGPVNGPVQKVNSMAAQAMDHPVLKEGHSLTIDASVSGYPIVVHGEFGKGKVVIVFAQGWAQDQTKSNNAYRSTIFQKDNIQFLQNCIDYFKN